MDLNELSRLEANVIACLKASVDDEAFVNLVRLLAMNRITNGRKKLFQAQYSACLSYGYQFIKGPTYALQAEEHAENARNLLLSCASGPVEAGDLDGPCYLANPRTMMLIILLTYYTLARAKLLLHKDREAVKIALKAKSTLNELLSMESESTEHTSTDLIEGEQHSGTECSSSASSDERVTSPLLRPGGGFYPSLSHLQIRLWTLIGKGLANQEKLLSAEEHYSKALELTENAFGADSKETIPIIQAICQLYEKRKGEEAMQNVIHLNEKLMNIAMKEYEQSSDLSNLLQVTKMAHRLGQAYLSANDPKLEEKAQHLLLNTIQMRCDRTSENEPNDDGDASILVSARSNDDRMMSVSQQLFHSELKTRKHSEQPIPQEQLKKQHIEATCALRSLLIRIYLMNKRYEEAEQLLQNNLTIQQVVFGLYSPEVVSTQKMLLTSALARGSGFRCLTQARECLAMEEVTFGTKSKQANRTREIIAALGGSTA